MTEWISVKDKLPERMSELHSYTQSVLVLLDNGDNRWCAIDRYDWTGKYWDVYHFGVPKVTHWMPLPEPPKR